MKIRNGVLFLFVILLMVTMSSCYHRGYLPLSQPDQMVLHYKDGKEKIFFPGDEEFKKLFECVSTDLWVVGSSPIYYAWNDEELLYSWKNEDYLHLIYHEETTIIESYPYWLEPDDPDKNWQTEYIITGIIFTPNMEGEEYYYLETPEGIIRTPFDGSVSTGHLGTPYYPPLSDLFDELRS